MRKESFTEYKGQEGSMREWARVLNKMSTGKHPFEFAIQGWYDVDRINFKWLKRTKFQLECVGQWLGGEAIEKRILENAFKTLEREVDKWWRI